MRFAGVLPLACACACIAALIDAALLDRRILMKAKNGHTYLHNPDLHPRKKGGAPADAEYWDVVAGGWHYREPRRGPVSEGALEAAGGTIAPGETAPLFRCTTFKAHAQCTAHATLFVYRRADHGRAKYGSGLAQEADGTFQGCAFPSACRPCYLS